jgi:hypothetical protein
MSTDSSTPETTPARFGNITIRVAKRIPGLSREVSISEGDFRRAAGILQGKETFPWRTFATLTSVAVVLLPFAVQYVSWINTNWQSAAEHIVTRAATAFKQAESAIEDRRYASFVVLDAFQDLANRNGAVDDLSNAHIKHDRDRIDAYYTQLDAWNDAYNGNLIAIDYDLDHPIYQQADQELKIESTISTTKFLPKLDCSDDLREAVTKGKQHGGSLKAQFAVIGMCYMCLNEQLDASISAVKPDAGAVTKPSASTTAGEPTSMVVKGPAKDQSNKKLCPADPDVDLSRRLSNEATMIDVFECNARQRIKFYIDEVQYNIVSPLSFLRWLFFEGSEQRASDHFKEAKKACG